MNAVRCRCCAGFIQLKSTVLHNLCCIINMEQKHDAHSSQRTDTSSAHSSRPDQTYCNYSAHGRRMGRHFLESALGQTSYGLPPPTQYSVQSNRTGKKAERNLASQHTANNIKAMCFVCCNNATAAAWASISGV